MRTCKRGDGARKCTHLRARARAWVPVPVPVQLQQGGPTTLRRG